MEFLIGGTVVALFVLEAAIPDDPFEPAQRDVVKISAWAGFLAAVMSLILGGALGLWPDAAEPKRNCQNTVGHLDNLLRKKATLTASCECHILPPRRHE